MNKEKLVAEIYKKKSFLCVGLDTDINRIPKHLLDAQDPVFEFNKAIIDATKDLCVAYKPNIAFYESMGIEGWESLKKTMEYIPKNIFTIADAKRGDIGNTSKMYAKTFFETFAFDAVTIAPYMGEDSVTPFLNFEKEKSDKWAILLALTSNKGAEDFQFFQQNDQYLYERVLEASKEWGSEDNMMYVVGATKATMLVNIRKIIPNHFLLVPGVGAQGGSLQEVVKYGMIKDCGLLVNSSRGIIYASEGKDFDEAAREKAKKIQQEMAAFL